MLLALIGAYKWIVANWKLMLIVGVVASSFLAGWYVRGEIATAAKNKAIAETVKATQLADKDLYDKAIEQEKRKRAIRERTRVANVAINSAAGDQCSDMPIPAQWLLIIQNAITGAASVP